MLSSSFAFATLLVPVVTLTTCVFPLASSRDPGVTDGLRMEGRFHGWMAMHGRSYATAEEKLRRFEIYQRNVEFIDAANRDGRLTYELGENEFTDLTDEEFLATYTSQNTTEETDMVITTRAGDVMEMPRWEEDLSADQIADLPESIDWRTRQPGSVTNIKNQDRCGACWAFAAVAAMESAHAIKHGVRAPVLSEQQLVDCDYYDNGCKGGKPYDAFKWVQRNGGIATNSDYPYENREGKCKKSKFPAAGVQVKGYAIVQENNEAKLMQAVAKQPVSVLFDSGDKCFRCYKSGVYDGLCIINGKLIGPYKGTKPTHSMAIIGYDDVDTGRKYWIAKNSWGTSWGFKGYVQILKDVPASIGLCGLAFKPSYPIVA